LLLCYALSLLYYIAFLLHLSPLATVLRRVWELGQKIAYCDLAEDRKRTPKNNDSTAKKASKTDRGAQFL